MDLYNAAATVLEKFENKQGSVKGLVFASGYKNVRQLYALVCESLKLRPVLSDIFAKSTALQEETDLQGQGHLATVLLYEHLVGKGLGRAGRLRNCILKHKSEIQKICEELMKEKGVTSLADLLSPQCQALNKHRIPRYVRVNLLKTTTQEAVAMFKAEGWQWRGELNLQSFQRDVEALGQEAFGSDPLLPDLLIFPPGTDLHDHPWVKGGCVALQDRASCFPAHVLNPASGATVLDCCAAPGNKTSHSASLMGNTGRIWAFERDAKRVSLLQQQLRKNGVSVATTMHQDFLSVDPLDERFADVEYILVDPSCSGSGIVDRMDHMHSTCDASNSARILSLQRFQISILKHALRFPHAKRVVYSTCSVYEEENEKVVAEVAQQVQDKFRVKTVFPQFPHRGIGSENIAKKCMRMSPEHDWTNGFFVACFERVSGDSVERENVHEEESVDGEIPKVEAISPSLKKNRKRKRAKGSKAVETVGDPDCGDYVPYHEHGRQEDREFGETPKKKKKKKKCKSKKKALENVSDDLITVQNGSGITQDISQDSFENDKKPTSAEKRNEINKNCPSFLQAADVPNQYTDTSFTENVAEKKKAKKKRNRSTNPQNENPSTHLQTKQTHVEPSLQDSATMETHKKKKKKERLLTSQKGLLTLETCEKSDTNSLNRQVNLTDQTSTLRKKKKKNKKKKEQMD